MNNRRAAKRSLVSYKRKHFWIEIEKTLNVGTYGTQIDLQSWTVSYNVHF